MDSEEECLVNDHQVNKFYLKENSDVTLNPTPTHDAKTCWVRFTCYPEPVLFLVGLGFFSFVPLNQEYLYQRYYKRALEAVGGNSTMDRGVLDIQSEINNTQLIDDIATRVSIYASSNATLFSANMALFRCIPPIFTSILICGSTDSFGRRFGLCLPIIGGILRALCYLTVEVAGLQLEWLFLGELIDGLFGEHLTFFACSTAYISDVASKESLVLRVIICSTMYIIASSIGNFALGLVIGYVGFAWGIVLVALCYCFALLYVIFVLAESLPKSETKKFTWSRLLNSTVRMYEVLTRQRIPSSDRTSLWLLDLSILLFSIAILGTFDVETIFMLGVPFNMDSTHIGVVIGIAMIFWAFVPILRTSLLKRCVSDEATLIITALIAIVAFVIQGFCTTPQQILTVLSLLSFGIGSQFIGTALMSMIVDPGERGTIQASNSCVSSIGEVLSKTLMPGIYAWTVDIFPGTVLFVIAGVLAVYCAVCTGIWFIRRKLQTVVADQLDINSC